MLEEVTRAAKSVTFTVVLFVVGALFIILGLAGEIVYGGGGVRVVHPTLRIVSAAAGALLTFSAFIVEWKERFRTPPERTLPPPRTRRPNEPDNDPQDRLPQPVTVTYYHKFPEQELLSLVRGAKRRVWIQQTWISDWNSLCEQIRNALTVAGAGSALSVQLLFIHPESDLADARGRHSNDGPIKADVAHTICKIRQYRDDCGFSERQWSIHVTTYLPTFALFCVDDDIFLVPYLRGRNTLRSGCLKFMASEHRYADYLNKHFELLWRDSESVAGWRL